MVTGYLKQSFIQNISQQKNSKLHEIIITRIGNRKKSMSPALFMCKCQQTTIRSSHPELFIGKVCCIFWEHFFLRTPLGDCFCIIIILFSRDSFKKSEPPEQRGNKFILQSTLFG